MKILVTGASGGMAGYIINFLLKRNIKVVATSRNPDNIRNADFFNRVEYLPFDLAEKSEKDLFAYFGKPDALIHLAWDKLKEHKNPVHMEVILPQHKALIYNLVSNGLKDITVLGTVYEYGLREGMVKESDAPAPVVAYAEAKNQLREYIESLKVNYQFNFKWIRIFNVFSEGKSGGNLYSHLMTAVNLGQEYFNMSGGEQVRDYLTADEVTAIIIRIALQQKVQGIINCTSGKGVKLKEMLSDFIKKNGYNIKLNLGYYPYLDHEPMAHWGSDEKLKTVPPLPPVGNGN